MSTTQSTAASNATEVSRYRVLASDPMDAEFAQVLHQHIEDSPSILIALYCRGAAEVVKAFEGYSRRHGTTFYAWTMDRGIVVPGSRRLGEALRYVQQSVHFGIYLLPVAGQQLTPPTIAQLRQITRASDGVIKRVVLLNEGGDLPASILEYCAHIQLQPRSSARLRLRDGHWVR